MTSTRWLIFLFWVVVLGFALWTCVSRQSIRSGKVQSAAAVVMQEPAPKPVEAPRPDLKIVEPTAERIDEYRFRVRFKVVNRGQVAAEQVRLRVRPWAGGYLRDDGEVRTAEDSDAAQSGKDQQISAVDPGAEIPITLEFYERHDVLPAPGPRVDILGFEPNPAAKTP